MLGKKMFSITIIVSFIIFPQIISALDQTMEKVVFYDGVKLYGKLNSNNDFEVSLFLESYKNDGSKHIEKFWGYDRQKPTKVIKEISVIINGSKCFIPKDAIHDLADIVLPAGVYLMQAKSATVLYIQGGDGVSAYKASLKFMGNRLISRKIEFINQEGELDSETTTYK